MCGFTDCADPAPSNKGLNPKQAMTKTSVFKLLWNIEPVWLEDCKAVSCREVDKHSPGRGFLAGEVCVDFCATKR